MQISGMIPGVNIISRKVNVVSVNGAGEYGGVLRPQQGVLVGEAPQENF